MSQQSRNRVVEFSALIFILGIFLIDGMFIVVAFFVHLPIIDRPVVLREEAVA